MDVRDLPRPGIRLQLVLALAGLFALAFVPLFFAVASLTRATLRGEREAHARAMGRVVAARVVEAQVSRQPESLAPLLEAQLASSAGLVALALYDERGQSLIDAGTPEGRALLPATVSPGREDVRRASSRHGPALLVLIPGPRGAVLTVLRIDDNIGQGEPLLRLVALYTLLVASALLLFVTFALTRLVVRPLADLSHAARNVVEGGRRFPVPTAGAAELVTLGHSLAHMTDRLLANEQALRSQTEQLLTSEQQLRAQLAALERATAELRAAQDHLVRSERLASVGRLSAGLAHEVGNPLAALMGLQDLLLDGGLSPDEERDFLRRMRQETERIHRILRGLLDFARPAPVTPLVTSPGRVADAVREVTELLRPQKKMRDVQLSLDLPPELPDVVLGHEQLTQVLLNLLDNAADATGGRGHIALHASHQGDEVLLRVSDDGPGLDPTIATQLFEPFVTTKPVGEGTGLGLAVCRGLVSGVGGAIAFEDVPKGACVVVRLPVAEGDTP